MAEKTAPSETVARKSDDEVGKSGPAPAGGGRQTPEQAAVTSTGTGGRTDADRNREMRRAGGQAGRDPAPLGGSSSGHSDRKPAAGEGGKGEKER